MFVLLYAIAETVQLTTTRFPNGAYTTVTREGNISLRSCGYGLGSVCLCVCFSRDHLFSGQMWKSDDDRLNETVGNRRWLTDVECHHDPVSTYRPAPPEFVPRLTHNSHSLVMEDNPTVLWFGLENMYICSKFIELNAHRDRKSVV